MTLDELYGRGTAKAFQKACGDPSMKEVSIDEGVRVYVDWADGSTMKIDCSPERVNFLSLTSNRKGLYSDLCNELPELFQRRGVTHFAASPASEQASAVLRKRGDWKTAPRRGIRWEL